MNCTFDSTACGRQRLITHIVHHPRLREKTPMISTWLSRVFQRFSKPIPLSVETPVAIIGDLHGRADLLDMMLARLSNEAPSAQLVFVGDYVDRGPDSAAVLQRVMGLPNATCLMGNHERMLLEFIEDPAGQGLRWLKHGGLETLASFGVHDGEPEEQRDALLSSMGPATVSWLKSRPLYFRSGRLYITHAGADPAISIEAQNEATLLWGHPDFGRKPRQDGHWVAHGHTIVPTANMHRGCIALDTGAYATDRLSAALISGEDLVFVEVPA